MKNKRSLKNRILPVLLIICLAVLAMPSVKVQAAGISSVDVYNHRTGEQISHKEFATPYQAWNEAVTVANKSNDTVITLGSDWGLNRMLEFSGDKRLTLDLNGYTVNRGLEKETEDGGGLFKFSNNVEFTVKDSRPKSAGYDGVRGGVLTGGASADTGGCFEILSNSKVILEGGTIYNCITDRDGGAVRCDAGGFDMDGGRIYFCQCVDSTDECSGGAIYLKNSSVSKLSNGKIDNCYSEDHGGAIYSEDSFIELRNMIFSGNRCLNYGGAICLWDDSYLNAHDCTFVNNRSEERGGAFYNDDAPDDDRPIMFHNCVFRNNESNQDGGALYLNDNSVVLSNTEVTGNYAKNRGGGVFVEAEYNISVRGLVTIKDNRCGKASMANLTLEYGTFTDAYIQSMGLYKGSCIYLSSTATEGDIKMTNYDFSEYQSRYLYADKGRLEFKANGNGRYISLISTASIFSEGKYSRIFVMAGIGILATAVVVIIKKAADKRRAAHER